MAAEVGLLGSTVFMAVVRAGPRQRCPCAAGGLVRDRPAMLGPTLAVLLTLLQEKGLTSLQRAFLCSPFCSGSVAFSRILCSSHTCLDCNKC